jgi:hypothetical protein
MPMKIRVEQLVQPTSEVHHLIGELNNVLGAVYWRHQRQLLSVEQLFEPYLRFFLGRLDRIARCWGVSHCSTRFAVRIGGSQAHFAFGETASSASTGGSFIEREIRSFGN